MNVHTRLRVGIAVFGVWLACTGTAAMAVDAQSAAQRHPNVVAVQVRVSGVGRFDFDVTVSSPYDSAERYADAFRVSAPDGRVLGERTLWHDHADEQPFTRDLYGVEIPSTVRRVILQARDQRYGWGGKTLEVALPGR